MSKAKSPNPLPYAVLGFQIENFGGIKKTELHDLPNSAKWIFLTGENGYGKTTVLQAVASGIKLEKSILNLNISGEYFIEIKSFQKSKELKEIVVFNKLNLNKNIIPISAYGSSRLNVSPTEDDKSLSNPIASLFDSRTVLRNIEFQLSRWHLKQEDVEFKTKFESVCRVLKHLLPIREIKVDFKTDKVTYVENDPEKKGYEPVEFRQLASGFKSIIALVGDMILRMFETQPKVYDPAELEGIVLIDELDLHFHPNIQRELPRMLSEVFPKIQFIATTHSPIPILGAPAGSVFLTVRRNKEEGITVHRINMDVSELTPNLILTSPIFG
ncbi:MAG: AAA family ATPase, partial [Saprospiraceae bacterium]|nr:AAA family ATPase [Saprospiraceae bacterium]